MAQIKLCHSITMQKLQRQRHCTLQELLKRNSSPRRSLMRANAERMRSPMNTKIALLICSSVIMLNLTACASNPTRLEQVACPTIPQAPANVMRPPAETDFLSALKKIFSS